MKSLKRLMGFVVVLLILIARDVKAESVKVRTGGFTDDAKIIATIPAERNVTTLKDLKEVLTSEYDIDFTKYMAVDYSYNSISDTEVVCGEKLNCFGPIDEMYAYLTLMPIDSTEKNITVNTIPPKDESMFEGIYQTNHETFEDLNYLECDETFTKCVFANTLEFKIYDNVVITYNYDEGIKELAQKAVDSGLLDKTKFTLTDTEFLNYLNYGGILADYSSEFKNQLANLNFRFDMDVRGGGFDPFETAEIGFYKFMYNDTLYAVKDFMEIKADHVIYVPTDTTDVKESIQERLKELFGDNNHLTVSESTDTINDLLRYHGFDTIDDGNVPYYTIVSNNENSFIYGMEFTFKAIKDSSKVNNEVSFKSSDLITNVIVTTDSNVPLDTIINVSKLTSGTQYDKIMKTLGLSESEMFDISLYSNIQEKKVTKLDNGNFMVSVPIPEKFNGKNLIIYYVDENNEVTEHEVIINNGYATFETNHFSVYTLAEKEGTTETTKTNNPQTGDKSVLYLMLFVISVIGLFNGAIYLKTKNK